MCLLQSNHVDQQTDHKRNKKQVKNQLDCQSFGYDVYRCVYCDTSNHRHCHSFHCPRYQLARYHQTHPTLHCPPPFCQFHVVTHVLSRAVTCCKLATTRFVPFCIIACKPTKQVINSRVTEMWWCFANRCKVGHYFGQRLVSCTLVITSGISRKLQFLPLFILLTQNASGPNNSRLQISGLNPGVNQNASFIHLFRTRMMDSFTV